ncbi:MAG: DUF1292 domain-containing protein [Clostridia bacterium]|nr:DUF1292 domain-containing protein [Clostridia bacterium]
MAKKEFFETPDDRENPDSVDEFYDDEEGTDVITLISDDGEEIEFYELAQIEHEGKIYSIMRPVDPFEDMGDDDVIVFRMDSDGDDIVLNVETDDEIADAVIDEYNELYDEEE